MADGIVRKQKNTVLTMTVSTVFFAYSGVGFALSHSDSLIMHHHSLGNEWCGI